MMSIKRDSRRRWAARHHANLSRLGANDVIVDTAAANLTRRPKKPGVLTLDILGGAGNVGLVDERGQLKTLTKETEQ
jgi:hypothetical protein